MLAVEMIVFLAFEDVLKVISNQIFCLKKLRHELKLDSVTLKRFYN